MSESAIIHVQAAVFFHENEAYLRLLNRNNLCCWLKSGKDGFVNVDPLGTKDGEVSGKLEEAYQATLQEQQA